MKYWLARVLRIVAMSLIASNLVAAKTSLARDVVLSKVEDSSQNRQLVSYDQQLVSEEVDLIVGFDAEQVSSYQQWLTDAVMPLLDTENHERPVSRKEFAFILEVIATRYGHNWNAEIVLLRNYCEIHYSATDYLHGRITSLTSDSNQLVNIAHNTIAQSDQSYPLRPLWQRKQTERNLYQSTQAQNKQHTNDQLPNTQLENRIGLAPVESSADPAEEATDGIFSTPDSWPTDISRTSDLAYPVELIYSLFGDVSFEDGTFRPMQAVTHGELIDYFSRQTIFSEELDTVDITQVKEKYDSLREASERLAVVLDGLVEARSLIDNLREAITSSPKSSPRNKSRSLSENHTPKIVGPQSSTVKSIQSLEHADRQITNSLTSGPSSIQAINSVSEILDVSPSDSVYAPLQVLVEEIGVDMVQADGNFNGEAPLTRGELARYIEPIWVGSGFLTYIESETCGRARDEYSYLQTEVQRLQLEVQQILSQLNED